MLHDAIALLRDPTLTWSQRRTRIQGWTGADAACADTVTGAQRIGPAVCAVGGLAGAALASPLLLGVFAVTALVGTFARNHPFEWVYNRIAADRGRLQMPPNRAAKRLGCAIGTVFLGGAAVAMVSGLTTLGVVLAVVLGLTAAFVAVTRICVPSLLFTVLWGADRAAAATLKAAATRRSQVTNPETGIRTTAATGDG